MKIAILTPWSISPTAVGGTERFVMDLANSLSKLGNLVDVYMLSGIEYKANGVNYKSINLFGTNTIVDEFFLRNIFNNFSLKESYQQLADKIESLINLNDYDLIQLNSQLFLNCFKDKKRIFTIHTNPFEYELDWGKEAFDTMINIMNEECNNKTIFVAPSIFYSNEYSKLSNIEVKYIPHAIDVDRLKSNKENAFICESLHLDIKKRIILLPSRLEPIQKQPMLFMKAFSKIDNNIKKEYQVVCTGADKQYIQYKENIENFCKENNIDIIITRFEDMSDAYKVASIVVLPSQSESFGYSALESLSLGIPTVLNDIPTYKEIAKNSKNSYIFNKTEESLFNVLNIIFKSDLSRILQNEDWINQYKLELFGRKYLNLIK